MNQERGCYASPPALDLEMAGDTFPNKGTVFEQFSRKFLCMIVKVRGSCPTQSKLKLLQIFLSSLSLFSLYPCSMSFVHVPPDIRYSLISCGTDDTIDTCSLATPLDASPSVPHTGITVVPNEEYPDRPHIPNVTNNHRRRTTQHLSVAPNTQEQNTGRSNGFCLWPRLKRIVSGSSIARMTDRSTTGEQHCDQESSTSTQTSNTTFLLKRQPTSSPDTHKGKETATSKNKRRWFNRDKARIRPSNA